MIPDKKPIATGYTADIIEWDEKYVIKLFKGWTNPGLAERELQNTQIAHAAGLKVPYAREIIEVNSRRGIVFERLDGMSMLHHMQTKPFEIAASLRLFGQLHADMHAIDIETTMPLPQTVRLASNIQHTTELSPDLKKAVLTALESMPKGSRLCHMDFHPDNIILTEKGPFIIDWDPAGNGNPLADVAATSIIIWGGDPANRPGSLKRAIEKGIGYFLNRSYLKHYAKSISFDRDQYLAWLPIVAASRLDDGHLNLQKWLLSVVETGIRNYH